MVVVLAAALALASAVAQSAPLTYDAALRAADASPTVRLAEQALARAERQAAATGVPVDLSLSAGYDRTEGSLTPAAGAPSEDLSEGNVAPIALTVRVDPAVLGPGADEIARARAAVDAARDDLAAARRAARIDTVQAFQDALRAETEVTLAEAEADLAARRAEDARARRDVGAAADLDVAQADLAVARAEQALAAARRGRDLAARGLALALGMDGAHPIGPLPDPAAGASLPTGTADGALEPTLARRPDLRAAERDVHEADRTAAAQVRSVLPVLRVEAGYATGDDARSLRVGAQVDSAALAPALNLAYDPDDGLPGVAPGGSRQAFEIGVRLEVPFSPALPDALAAVRLGQDLARARRAAAADQAELAVARARAALLDAEEAAHLASRATELAADELAVATARAATGAASDAVVARAELDLARAELDAARAQDALRLALFRLYDALALPPEALE